MGGQLWIDTRINAKTFYLVLLGVVIAILSLALQPKQVKGDFEETEVTAEEPILGVGELAPNPVVVEQLYQDWTKEQARKKRAPAGNFCSCVIYAKSITGYSVSVGNARNWPKNVAYPVIGGVVITNESRAGHVAVITAVHADSIEVVEANYYRCRKSTRTILLNSPVILGFWR